MGVLFPDNWTITSWSVYQRQRSRPCITWRSCKNLSLLLTLCQSCWLSQWLKLINFSRNQLLVKKNKMLQVQRGIKHFCVLKCKIWWFYQCSQQTFDECLFEWNEKFIWKNNISETESIWKIMYQNKKEIP